MSPRVKTPQVSPIQFHRIHPNAAGRSAHTLTVRVATYLAKEIAAASRFNLSPTELKRPTSNLVKIASHVKAKPGDAVVQGDQHTTMTDWLGADCPVDFLNVWFPAHWSPIVLRELYAREVKLTSTICGLILQLELHTLTGQSPKEAKRSRVENCTSILGRWMQKRISPHSLASSGTSWPHTCTQNGQEYIALQKSMTDCLPTLVEMTTSRTLSRRRHGTRLPTGIGLASGITFGAIC